MTRLLYLFTFIFLFNPCPGLVGLDSGRILFLLKTGHLSPSIDLYEQQRGPADNHDLELLQQMGATLLEQGCRSKDPEIQLLTLFGAGISGDDRVLNILKKGISTQHPQFQLVSLNFLSKCNNDDALEMINAAMTSDFLPIRLEAVFQLAKWKHPKAPGQIESLLQKVPSDIIPLFPQLFAMCGDSVSMRSLQKMLAHPNESVRIEAILAVAKYGRDDLLPSIRRLSSHLNAAQQEACATALGLFKDEYSFPRLLELSNSSSENVRLAALYALFRLGREEVRVEIEKLALKENLHAIALLGQIPGSEPTLSALLKAPHANTRINAALALMERKDIAALRGLPEILIKDPRDLVFVKYYSPGKGMLAWKCVPSARQNFAANRAPLETSLHFREGILSKTMDLPEKGFLALAQLILECNQNDLVPLLTELLVNLRTPEAVNCLEHYRDKVGVPLIRNYCNLALFRLKEQGPYGDSLKEWLEKHHNHDLIQFRPLIPWEMRSQDSAMYRLTPDDTSRLFVDSLEALVQTQDERTIDFLLKAIKDGNPKNRYALAGLLIRAAN